MSLLYAWGGTFIICCALIFGDYEGEVWPVSGGLAVFCIWLLFGEEHSHRRWMEIHDKRNEIARDAKRITHSDDYQTKVLELESQLRDLDAQRDEWLKSKRALNSGFVPAGHLSAEQKQAVASILRTRDRVFSFRGVAGAGKTTTLREVQRGLSEAGHTIFAITPTASAAQVLRNEGFAQATTVEDFLRNAEKQGEL